MTCPVKFSTRISWFAYLKDGPFRADHKPVLGRFMKHPFIFVKYWNEEPHVYIHTHKSISTTYTNYIVVTTLIPINWPSWKCWKAQRMYKSHGQYWDNLPTLSDFQDFFHQKRSKSISFAQLLRAKAGYCLWCPRDRGGFAEGLAVKHEEKCKLHGKGRAA